jgi:hypothetical protein
MSWTIESVREANVAPADVYALYADPETWRTWGHNAASARADGPLVESGSVEVRARYGVVYRCLVRRLARGRALELLVTPPLLTVVNFYEVDPAPRGARIRHAIEVSGPLASLTRAIGVDRVYRLLLDREVRAVVRMAGEVAS